MRTCPSRCWAICAPWAIRPEPGHACVYLAPVSPEDLEGLESVETVAKVRVAEDGQWDLVDGSHTLGGERYLVTMEVAGHTPDPAGYQVVVTAGKGPHVVDDVDFTLISVATEP